MVVNIIEKLGKVFSKSFRQKLERQESLDELIAVLTAKEEKLAKKLSHANEEQAKVIATKIEVLQAQILKAQKLREEEKTKY